METESFLSLLSCDFDFVELEDSTSWPSGDQFSEGWLDGMKLPPSRALDALMICADDPKYTSVLTLSDVSAALQDFSAKTASSNCARSSSSVAIAASTSAAQDYLVCAAPIATPESHRLLATRPFVTDEKGKLPVVRPARSDLATSSGAPSVRHPSTFKKLKAIAHGQSQSSSLSPVTESLSQREMHICSERQRRKSIRESFCILQSLVPKLNLKHMDRNTVLTEVIKYIKTLRGTVEELKRKKAAMMELLGITEEDMLLLGSLPRGEARGIHMAKVEVNVRMCGSAVFVRLSVPRRQAGGVWWVVLMVLQLFQVDVCNATLATSRRTTFHCIHGKILKEDVVDVGELQEKLERVIVKHLEKRPKN